MARRSRCRTEHGWSAPAPITITGGSWGLQLGGQAVDLVMVVMNQSGMDHLLASKFKLGADATAAAGPVGREDRGRYRYQDALGSADLLPRKRPLRRS